MRHARSFATKKVPDPFLSTELLQTAKRLHNQKEPLFHTEGHTMHKTATIHAQQRWEYRELTRKTVAYLLHELNDLGHQGWELISVLNAKNPKGEMVWTAILKRPYVPGVASPKAGPVEEATLHRPARIEPTHVPPPETSAEFEFDEPDLPTPEPEPKLPVQ